MLDVLARFVFPLACPGCGAVADPICDECARSLRAAPQSRPPAGVDAWAAPFAYEGAARELIARVKYRRMHAATDWLAASMAEVAKVPDNAIVTWAPTTKARRRQRGFDHAELLARRFGAITSLPVRPLLRRATVEPQTGRSAAARRHGPVFWATRGAPHAVVVIDDVATTGATLRAAAKALRVVGAYEVVAITAARTPRPS